MSRRCSSASGCAGSVNSYPHEFSSAEVCNAHRQSQARVGLTPACSSKAKELKAPRGEKSLENDPLQLVRSRAYRLQSARRVPCRARSLRHSAKTGCHPRTGTVRVLDRLVSQPFSAKQPTFGGIDPVSGGALQSMLNWSGALISTPWPQQFVFAAAGWNVPDERPPSASALVDRARMIQNRYCGWASHGRSGALPNISLPPNRYRPLAQSRAKTLCVVGLVA